MTPTQKSTFRISTPRVIAISSLNTARATAASRNDLPTAENGCREFAAEIPHDMSEQEILNVWLLWPMKPGAPYPKWEVPARVEGSPMLYRWWAGEKPR